MTAGEQPRQKPAQVVLQFSTLGLLLHPPVTHCIKARCVHNVLLPRLYLQHSSTPSTAADALHPQLGSPEPGNHTLLSHGTFR